MSDARPGSSSVRRLAGFVAVAGAIGFGVWFDQAQPETPAVRVVGELLTGWFTFARQVFVQVMPEPYAVGSAAVYAVAFVVGLHFFLRGARRMGTGDAQRPWRLRWTAAIAVSAVLMFAAGVATVGVTHQAVWMVRPQEKPSGSGTLRSSGPHRTGGVPPVAHDGIASPVTRRQVADRLWLAFTQTEPEDREAAVDRVRFEFADEWHLETVNGNKVQSIIVMARDPKRAAREQALVRIPGRDVVVTPDQLVMTLKSLAYGLIRRVDELQPVTDIERAILADDWDWERDAAATRALTTVHDLPPLKGVTVADAVKLLEKKWKVSIDGSACVKAGFDLSKKVMHDRESGNLQWVVKCVLESCNLTKSPDSDDYYPNGPNVHIVVEEGRVVATPYRYELPILWYRIGGLYDNVDKREQERREDELAEFLIRSGFHRASIDGSDLTVTATPGDHMRLRELLAAMQKPQSGPTTDPARLERRRRELATLAALDAKIPDLKLGTMPCRQAIERLRAVAGAKLSIDWSNLGVDPAEPAEIATPPATLRAALVALLDHGRDGAFGPSIEFGIDDGVIHVWGTNTFVSTGSPLKRVVVVVYELPAGIRTGDSKWEWRQKVWSEHSRDSTDLHFWRDRLVVLAPEWVHGDIEKRLAEAGKAGGN